MYNGIGLQSSRGSGTSGYVQKNLSTNVKKLQSRQQFLRQMQQKRKMNLPTPRKANEQIVQHQRKRQILIQSMKLRQRLQQEKVPAQEIQLRVKKLQQSLKQKLQEGKLQTKAKQTHILTQAKQKQYNKLSKIMGVSQKRQIGSAFDFKSQQEQKLKRKHEQMMNQSQFTCGVQGCGKNYRERELLDRHIKYKHPQIYEEYKKAIQQAQKQANVEAIENNNTKPKQKQRIYQTANKKIKQ